MKLSKDTLIAVVKGGFSDEREVSLVTGSMVAKSLVGRGYTRVVEVDMDRDIDVRLREIAPDVVFNALHGTWGEDGRFQGMLDIMGIPYTGSGVTSSAMGMNKNISRRIMNSCGIKVADGYSCTVVSGMEPEIGLPLVVKDAENGSSRGVYLVRNMDEWNDVVSSIPEGREVVVERYFRGREINVAVLGDEVLGDVEIIPAGEWYDFEAKYESDGTRYVVNPEYDPSVREEIRKAALDIHETLGCSGATRSDFIVSGSDYIMLEINTLPGMTSHSLLPMIALERGIDYGRLVEILLEEALGV